MFQGTHGTKHAVSRGRAGVIHEKNLYDSRDMKNPWPVVWFGHVTPVVALSHRNVSTRRVEPYGRAARAMPFQSTVGSAGLRRRS